MAAVEATHLETPDDVVVASNVTKAYTISRPPRTVVDHVTLTVRRGEFLALMGPSGCGKSTLLHILGGLEPPDSGTVHIEGSNLYTLGDAARSAFRRDRIGFVFQFFNLIPSLTAAENVELPLRLRGAGGPRRRREMRERVAALMTLLNLRGLQGHGPEEISGGEQQRVAIARALAAAPVLLLADEPTGNLDWTTGHEVMQLLSSLTRQEHQTTVLVTHDARIAAYAERVLIMQDGHIVDEIRLDHPRANAQGHPDPAPLVQRLAELDL